MNQDPVYSKMLNITNQLLKNPLAVNFAQPFEPAPEFSQLYYSKVSKPMDLSTVKRKLHEKRYKTVHDWANDVRLIFDNAVAFNTEASFFGGLAIFLKNEFEKEYISLIGQNSRTFESKLIKLSNKLSNLLSNPPQNAGINTLPAIQPINENEFTLEKIDKITEQLKQRANQIGPERILNTLNASSTNESFGPETVINISRLGRKSLHSLDKILSSTN